MAHIKSADDTPFLSEINMIPLIDVALVLLIIFMVITPQMVLNSIQVKLPKSTSASTPPPKILTIAVTPEGKIYLNNDPVTLKKLTGEIKKLPKQQLEGALIYSDRTVPISKVVDVIDQIKAAGVHNINLTTKRK